MRQFLRGVEGLPEFAEAPPEPLPQFGRWNATRLLGRGGMGNVYLAVRSDGAFEMSVAVKVAPLALASPEIEDRMRQEGASSHSGNHPGGKEQSQDPAVP